MLFLPGKVHLVALDEEMGELRALRELREMCGMYCEQLPVEVRRALHAVPETEKVHSCQALPVQGVQGDRVTSFK
jgi:hypothetical protein